MWRKGIVTLIGCGIVVQAWITGDGVLVFTRDAERVAQAVAEGEAVAPIRMAPIELYELDAATCEAVKQRLRDKEERQGS